MDYQIRKARVGGTTTSKLYCKFRLFSFYNYFLKYSYLRLLEMNKRTETEIKLGRYQLYDCILMEYFFRGESVFPMEEL